PMIHQMIDIGPAPRFADTTGMIEYPIVRDMDTNMYERQEGTGLEIGSYAHRPIALEADEIPSVEETALSPTELAFTHEDFEPQRGPGVGGLQRAVRDRPSRRAVGVQPRRPSEPVLRARARSGCRALRDSVLGAPALVRVERAAARGVRRPDQPARGGVGPSV